MRVLVIGNGGREHALVWKLGQSPLMTHLYCAPGNAGTAGQAENIAIDAADTPALLDFAGQQRIDFTVVGPEIPLALGVVDAFQQAGLAIFGPTQAAAQLETSKSFAKGLMGRHDIPTAPFRIFSDPHAADAHIEGRDVPVVVKADGLAGGKGVVVCKTRDEAHRAIDQIMRARVFGAAGDRVILEDFLQGEEASFFALTDGTHVVPLPSSQDHKAAFDHDEGPNTGGMGAYSPAPVLNATRCERVMAEIVQPTLSAMAGEGIAYRGVLYVGLMLVAGQPYVLEFNVRFGDPEAQALLVRLESDLLPLLLATTDGTLDRISSRWRSEPSVCVVMASRGYPETYARGRRIAGIERAEQIPGVVVFHAGTACRDGELVTDGGRVLGVTALGRDLHQAIDHAYRAVHTIGWEGVHFRSDIGYRALAAG
jgi:phosphoribosylamine--glycine ligase